MQTFSSNDPWTTDGDRDSSNRTEDRQRVGQWQSPTEEADLTDSPAGGGDMPEDEMAEATFYGYVIL